MIGARRGRAPPSGIRRALVAGKAELCLPWTVGKYDLPIAFCDFLRIEGGARDDLPHDRQRRHADSVGFQIGSEQGGRGSKRCLAEGYGRKGRDRMIREAATRHNDGAGARGSHRWGSDLCHNDGTDDIHRIGRLRVLGSRVQEGVRSAHDGVVDD